MFTFNFLMRLYCTIAKKSSRDNFIFASVTALIARLIGAMVATTVESLESGHPRARKKLSITGAGCLREYQNK